MGGGVQRKAADSCVFGGVVWNVGHVGNNPHAHATPHFNPAGSAAKIVVKVYADSKTKRSVLTGGLVQRLLSVRPENPMAGESSSAARSGCRKLTRSSLKNWTLSMELFGVRFFLVPRTQGCGVVGRCGSL